MFSKPRRRLSTFCVALGLVAPLVPAQSPPALSVQVSNGSVWLSLTGDVGSVCTIDYCAQLTQQQQSAGQIPAGWAYRLPTESEWEYACRAETATAFNFGNAIQGGMANFYDHWEYDASVGSSFVANPTVPHLDRTTTVGSYSPNGWGLYDMHGNVLEWCQDWYDTYPTGSVTDPMGPLLGSYRVSRGGCFSLAGRYCRSAWRYSNPPSNRSNTTGFRVVLAQG